MVRLADSDLQQPYHCTKCVKNSFLLKFYLAGDQVIDGEIFHI
jgi:hypothetical protein